MNTRQPDYTTAEVSRLFRVRQGTPREAYCRDGHWMGIRPIKLPSRRLLWPRVQVDALLRGEDLSHTTN